MKKFILIWILILILLSSLSVSSQTISKDTSQKEILEQKGQIDSLRMELERLKEGNYEKAMESANRSIDLANLILYTVGFIVALMTALGIFSYIKTGQIRKKAEKEWAETRKLKEDAETFVKDIRAIHEEVKEARREIDEKKRSIDKSEKSVEETKTEVSAISYFTEGNRFYSQKEYDRAIENYRKATELKPDYAQAYYNWGVALGELGRYEEEIERYRKAIELKPDYAEAYVNWGVALEK